MSVAFYNGMLVYYVEYWMVHAAVSLWKLWKSTTLRAGTFWGGNFNPKLHLDTGSCSGNTPSTTPKSLVPEEISCGGKAVYETTLYRHWWKFQAFHRGCSDASFECMVNLLIKRHVKKQQKQATAYVHRCVKWCKKNIKQYTLT